MDECKEQQNFYSSVKINDTGQAMYFSNNKMVFLYIILYLFFILYQNDGNGFVYVSIKY